MMGAQHYHRVQPGSEQEMKLHLIEDPLDMPQTSPFPDTGHLLGYTALSFLLLDAFKHYCSLIFLLSTLYFWDPVYLLFIVLPPEIQFSATFGKVDVHFSSQKKD